MSEKNNPLSTVCDLMWNYSIFNMERGEFRSCCRTPPNIVTEESLQNHGIDAFLNSEQQKQNRLDLIQGVKTQHCRSCWNLEEKDMKSPRHTPIQFWNHLQKRRHIAPELKYSEENLIQRLNEVKDLNDPALISKNPYMLEISLGNTCDMKCMYCTHHYSTQWASELIKYGDITQEQYDSEFPKAPKSFDAKFWEWFNNVGRHYLTRIGIIGGEPLIMPEFYVFLDKLLESITQVKETRKDKITFWIVTNMNTPPNYMEKLFQYLPKLTELCNLEILVSMESVGKKAEYIRNGVNWNKFTSNIDRLLSRKDLNFDFGFIMSLNALNITSIKDFIQYTESLYEKHGKPVALKQNIISFPSWQSPMVLTPDFANYLDDTITYMRSRQDQMPLVRDFYGRYDQYAVYLEELSNSLKNNKGDYNIDRHRFAYWFKQYDERRKLNLLETFPEYTEFYNLCQSLT